MTQMQKQVLQMAPDKSSSLRILFNDRKDIKLWSHSATKVIKNKETIKTQRNNPSINTMIQDHSSLKERADKRQPKKEDCIDKKGDKVYKRRLIYFDVKKEQQDNNKIISNLCMEMKNAQNQLQNIGNKQKSNEFITTLEERKKLELKQAINFLKKDIEINSKQLTQITYNHKFLLFDLMNERQQINQRQKEITQKLDNVISKNNETLKKIRLAEEKISQYESSSVIFQLNTIISQEYKYSQMIAQLKRLKLNAQRQRRRLQHVYSQKLTDLEYSIAGCDAIDQKIAEIDQRIKEANKDSQNQMQDHNYSLKNYSDKTRANTEASKIQKSASIVNAFNQKRTEKKDIKTNTEDRKHKRVKSVFNQEFR